MGRRKEAKMKPGEPATEWDPDMDYLLLEMDKRKMSYQAIASAMSVILGFEISQPKTRNRLRTLRGPAPRRSRGVPFTVQARELVCR